MFSDLEKYKAYSKYIDVVAANDIMKAKAGVKFMPGDSITRAELAEILVNTFKIPGINEKTLKCSFIDVKPSDKYYKAIALVAKAGLMLEDGKKFNSRGKVTRQDIALILAKALKTYKGISLNGDKKKYRTFSDSIKISVAAKDSVVLMTKYNIMSEKTGKEFKPFDTLIRAEVAQIMYTVLYLK